jgi:hypothetical protein
MAHLVFSFLVPIESGEETPSEQNQGSFFSLTEVSDQEGYIRWHQTDHMPEQFRIPGLTWGQRFAATPKCVETSAVREGPIGRAIHVQNYLMENPAQVLPEFTTLGRELEEMGRAVRGPKAHVQAGFELVRTYASPRILVSPDAVAYRPNRGIYLIVKDTADAINLDDWIKREHSDHSFALLDLPGVAGTWLYAVPSFRDPEYSDQFISPCGVPPSSLRISVLYLDGDPVEVSKIIRPHLDHRWSGAPVTPVLAGAFRSFFPPPGRWWPMDEDAYP